MRINVNDIDVKKIKISRLLALMKIIANERKLDKDHNVWHATNMVTDSKEKEILQKSSKVLKKKKEKKKM